MKVLTFIVDEIRGGVKYEAGRLLTEFCKIANPFMPNGKQITIVNGPALWMSVCVVQGCHLAFFETVFKN